MNPMKIANVKAASEKPLAARPTDIISQHLQTSTTGFE
jgi:hypothetical protein